MADRMTMARSLELRAPFCDHRLIELSLTMPPATKLAGGTLKALLKAAFADVLPAEVVRRRKQGFMIPLGRWLRTELRHLPDDALAPDGAAAAALERHGVRVVLFAVGRRSRVGFVRDAVFAAREAARGVLAASGFDVLNVYQPLAGYGVLGLPAARRVPALYTFLSPAPLESRPRERMTHQPLGGVSRRLGSVALWALERACLRHAGRIQVLSEYSAEQLWQLYRIAEDRFVKIPGGVDLRHFAPSDDRTGVRARLGLAKEAPLLLTVRNLEARMGLDTLLHALPRVLARHPGVQLLVAGTGSQRAALES